jgi:hypothetical protein
MTGMIVGRSKRRTHLVASRSMSERYGIDVIRSWTCRTERIIT